MPETGYKHLFKTYQHALDYSRTRLQEYTNTFQTALNGPYEYHSPTKKQTDENGFAIVFRNSEVQIWIEVIVK